MHTSSSSASLPLTLFSLPPWRDDNRINVSLGFRQRTDQIHAGGVETPDWLLYLTECLEEGGAVVVMVMGGLRAGESNGVRHKLIFFFSHSLFSATVFTSILENGGV